MVRTALVTKAETDLGVEFVRQLAEQGDRVIAVCTAPTAVLRALDAELVTIDFNGEGSIATGRRRIEEITDRIELLVELGSLLNVRHLLENGHEPRIVYVGAPKSVQAVRRKTSDPDTITTASFIIDSATDARALVSGIINVVDRLTPAENMSLFYWTGDEYAR